MMSQSPRTKIIHLANVSPLAWTMAGLGIALIGFGVYLFSLDDSASSVRWSTFPWHGLVSFCLGLNLALAASNADQEEYLGRGGRTKLFKRAAWMSVWFVLSAGIPIYMAIYLGRSMADAVQFVCIGVLLFQVCGFAFWKLLRHPEGL